MSHQSDFPCTGFVRLSQILAPSGPIPVSKSTWWQGVKDGRFPQCRAAFDAMPVSTEIERRNKALFACLMITGARDGALASLRLKHVDLVEGSIFQDARDVKTKGSKTFTTYFLPVDPVYLPHFEAWVRELREQKLMGHDEPPKKSAAITSPSASAMNMTEGPATASPPRWASRRSRRLLSWFMPRPLPAQPHARPVRSFRASAGRSPPMP